jgi:hypothetical protein
MKKLQVGFWTTSEEQDYNQHLDAAAYASVSEGGSAGSSWHLRAGDYLLIRARWLTLISLRR